MTESDRVVLGWGRLTPAPVGPRRVRPRGQRKRSEWAGKRRASPGAETTPPAETVREHGNSALTADAATRALRNLDKVVVRTPVVSTA